MGIALSSLRVSSDFDASGYIRGASQKNAADAAMIASDKARNAALAQADAAMAKAIPGMGAISRALLDGYGAGQQFEAQLRRINNVADQGGLYRVPALLDALYTKFGMTADAMQVNARGFDMIKDAAEAATVAFRGQIEAAEIAAAAAARVQNALSAQPGQRVSQTNLSGAIDRSFGIGGGAKDAAESASAFGAFNQEIAEGIQNEERMAKAAAALRAQINPLAVETVNLGKQMAQYRQMLNEGIISSKEFEQAQVFAAKRLSDFDMNLRQAATGGRVLSGELGNLGYQVNDVITGLALGQPVFMIAAQQGGQIYQIFSRSKAGIGEFAGSFISSVASMVTPARAAFAAVAAGIGLTTAALFTYEGRIQEVQRQLTGIGRASGATATGIDAIAQANSSPTGLSTNEARNLAAALAATGKVGVESIGPIVAIGHDFAKTFGVDAKEATEILAKAFADPAKGAEELNQRLGFLDANTKLLIESLVIQGNRTEAVRILTEKVKGSIANAADITSFWSRAATVAGNSLSNFFEQVGRGADRVFAGGSGLDEKISNLTIKLFELETARLSGNPLDALLQNEWPSDLPAKIAAVTAEINGLNAVRQKQFTAPSAETADKQRALEIDAIARATLPAIEATRQLRDETAALNQAFARPELQKQISLIGTDLVLAYQRKKAAADASVGADQVRSQIADATAQIAALDQRSIADRARFAREAEIRRQSLDPGAGTAAERLTKQNQAALLAAGGQTALDGVEKMRIGVLGSMAAVIAAAVKKGKPSDSDQHRLPKAA
jgi:hypothetical protein